MEPTSQEVFDYITAGVFHGAVIWLYMWLFVSWLAGYSVRWVVRMIRS